MRISFSKRWRWGWLHTKWPDSFQKKHVRLSVIPEGYEALTAIAVGYPGDPEELPEETKVRELQPRERKPLSAFVFSDGWGLEWSAEMDEE